MIVFLCLQCKIKISQFQIELYNCIVLYTVTFINPLYSVGIILWEDIITYKRINSSTALY